MYEFGAQFGHGIHFYPTLKTLAANLAILAHELKDELAERYISKYIFGDIASVPRM
jgi:hypothetical protein